MMKKIIALILFLMILMSAVAFAESDVETEPAAGTETESSANPEQDNEWAVAPVITSAYEQSPGQIYLEWEGKAPVYQVYVDGAKVADASVGHQLINVSKGTHRIIIYPFYVVKGETDTSLNLQLKTGEIPKIGSFDTSFSIDLAALGLDPKELIPGNPSETLNIDYKPNAITEAVPDKLSATTDFDDHISLSFSDQYNADEYEIMIKKGNNANYVTFHVGDEAEARLISRSNAIITLLLDPEFLMSQDCTAPDLDEEYRFSVTLRKYSSDYVTGEKISTVAQRSKASPELVYKPEALWKTEPVINYASQTADGQITLKWTHDDNGLGCEYSILQINKTLGIKTGEVEMGSTKEKEYVFNDILNGNYCFAVVPIYQGEKGRLSSEVDVEVKNDWVIAPSLVCEQEGTNQVKLTWPKVEGIESYVFTVYAGDSGSLLRFVDLDYSKYTDFTVEATNDEMNYLFTYDKEFDPEAGAKLKFEVYGIRHSADGKEQKTAVTTQVITLH